MIRRDDAFIIPTGGTILQSGDVLFVLSESDNAEYLNNLRVRFVTPLKENISIMPGANSSKSYQLSVTRMIK